MNIIFMKLKMYMNLMKHQKICIGNINIIKILLMYYMSNKRKQKLMKNKYNKKINK